MTDTADNGNRLGDLIDDLKAKITEIKSIVEPAFQSLADDVRGRAQELSDAIDAKVDEIKAAWDTRDQ